MQMNFPDPTPNERKVIRTWRLRVVTFYGSLCIILLLLSFISDRTAPTVADGPAANAIDTLAAR